MRQQPEVRPVHGRTPTSNELGLVLVGVVMSLAGVTVLAGQLAAVVTGRGWPSWSGVGLNLWAPVIGVFAHGGDPMRSWPGLAHGTPGALVFWPVFAVLLAVVLGLVVLVLARWRRGRGRPGFATRREIAGRLGTKNLVGQAPRLRPHLARTTPRPRPEQLGTHRGRDVATGADVWSSVRQSMYLLGPSESGKTAGVVIPEALDHDGPLILPSSRADAMAATWSTRADRGGVALFDPLHRSPGVLPVQWDLVRDCGDPVVAMRRAEQLMHRVDMSTTTDGDSWKSAGKDVLRNLIHAAALRHRNIELVLEWGFSPSSEEPYTILRGSSVTPDSWAKSQRAAATAPDKQQAGIYMAVQTALAMFAHPAVLASVTPSHRDHFDVQAFVDGGARTLYLLSEAGSVTAVGGLLAALIDEVLESAKARAGRSENNRLDPALKFLAEEAPNTAPLKILPNLVSDGAGRGIPATVVVQEESQAVQRWGQHDADTMWGAASVRMILPGLTDEARLRGIAGFVDDYDVELRSRSKSESGVSTQTSVRTVPGLTTARVRALPPWHSLIIAGGGLPLVETELTPYFRRADAHMTAEAERRFYAAVAAGRTVA